MKIKIAPLQTQKTILAPLMQQSIEVLMLPVAELNTAIEQEMQNNPLLEIDEEVIEPEKDHIQQIIENGLKNYEDRHSFDNYSFENDDDTPEEHSACYTRQLEDYLLQQLRLETTDALTLKIGELIIGNLNEDGYCNTSIEEVAHLAGAGDLNQVYKTLKMIQKFEPLGIASRNLKECLLIQADYKFNGDGKDIAAVIDNHLEDLGRKNFTRIARSLNMPIERVKEITRSIATLEPKPARNFRPVDSSIYVKPDIIIFKNDQNQYEVRICNDYIPQLRISRLYRKILTEAKRSQEEKNYISDKLKNAVMFIKSIEQRNQTLKDIANYILNHQKDFFENGHMALKSLTLKDVATSIERNESTVCRAISNKYMDTPQGFLPVKFFFSQSVSDEANGSVTSRSVKEEIKNIIHTENKNNPLSDQEIRLYFEKKQMKVSRRTITKYRQVMQILPSNLRKV